MKELAAIALCAIIAVALLAGRWSGSPATVKIGSALCVAGECQR